MSNHSKKKEKDKETKNSYKITVKRYEKDKLKVIQNF